MRGQECKKNMNNARNKVTLRILYLTSPSPSPLASGYSHIPAPPRLSNFSSYVLPFRPPPPKKNNKTNDHEGKTNIQTNPKQNISLRSNKFDVRCLDGSRMIPGPNKSTTHDSFRSKFIYLFFVIHEYTIIWTMNPSIEPI